MGKATVCDLSWSARRFYKHGNEGTMKIDLIRSGKDKKHVTVLLRECYRENGKVKNRTIANLSHMDSGTIEALRIALRMKGELPRLLEEVARKSSSAQAEPGPGPAQQDPEEY